MVSNFDMNKIFLSIICLLFVSFQISFAQEKNATGGIVNGKATYLPKPDYPQEAKNFCVDGIVEVQVLIGEGGNVISAEAISGDELLRDSAVEAAKKATFRMGHFAVKTEGKLVYNFVSEKKCIYAGVVNKKALKIPKPSLQNIVHPKHLKIEEPREVIVQIIIDLNGDVTNARALNGHPLIRSIFVNFARQAKFQPTSITTSPIFIKAILIYKIKLDGEVDTDIEKDIIGIPIDLVKPSPPFCNCRFGDNSSIMVGTEVDKNGNVIKAEAYNGHPILKNISEKAALKSKFLPSNLKAKVTIVYEFEAINDNRDVKISDIYIKEVKSDELTIGKALSLPKPPFPSFNGKLGNNSSVLVEVVIDEDGNVISAKAISGHPMLKAMSVAAARHSKFSQTKISGVRVKAKALLTYEYILADELIVNVIVNSIEPQK